MISGGSCFREIHGLLFEQQDIPECFVKSTSKVANKGCGTKVMINLVNNVYGEGCLDRKTADKRLMW